MIPTFENTTSTEVHEIETRYIVCTVHLQVPKYILRMSNNLPICQSRIDREHTPSLLRNIVVKDVFSFSLFVNFPQVLGRKFVDLFSYNEAI